VFGRCFRVEDVDTEDFERFIQMLQPKRDLKSEQQKLGGPFSQRIMPFPKRIHMGPGNFLLTILNLPLFRAGNTAAIWRHQKLACNVSSHELD
jgi:hypothetical protein